MQIRVFAIPMDGDDEAIEELNRFLRGQKVLCVEKVAVVDHGRHYWSVCVEYLPRRNGEQQTAAAGSSAMHSTKPRIDYREVLSKEEFIRFAKLRELRKQLADADGVPVYTILTNAQLAEVARAVPQTKTALAKIEGLGTAKLERFGDAMLSLLWSGDGAAIRGAGVGGGAGSAGWRGWLARGVIGARDGGSGGGCRVAVGERCV